MFTNTTLIFFFFCVYSAIFSQKTIIKDTLVKDVPHFIIKTQNATYLFDKPGGGFSSIKDNEGNEWIGYKKSPEVSYPASAASDYRGMPNSVHKGDDGGVGHPGFDKSISIKVAENKIKVTSKSKLWEIYYTFNNMGVQLNFTRTDTSRGYWFLYEGTPGGQFNPKLNYWGNNIDGLRTDTPEHGPKTDIKGNWEWFFCGHKNCSNTLYIIHLTPDSETDVFSYLGNSSKKVESDNGMVVFGIGREHISGLLRGENKFFIGFFNGNALSPKNFKKLQRTIRKVKKQNS